MSADSKCQVLIAGYSLNYPRDSRTHSLFNWRRSSLPIPLDEFGFREALDEYASAEMRFGK